MAIQSFGGGGKLVALGTVAQRTCFLSLLACIPVGFLWLHAERPLSFFVRDPEVAEGAALYLKWLVLALIASAGLYPATQYLRIQVGFDFTVSGISRFKDCRVQSVRLSGVHEDCDVKGIRKIR